MIEPKVIVAGLRGATGRAGEPGPAGGSMVQRVAGATVSALRVVYELDDRVFALDYRDTDHIDLILGVALTAADAGQALNVQRSGTIDDSAWSWTPGRIYLGAGGMLTQTPPEDGYSVLIGIAPAPTRINLYFQDPIELEN